MVFLKKLTDISKGPEIHPLLQNQEIRDLHHKDIWTLLSSISHWAQQPEHSSMDKRTTVCVHFITHVCFYCVFVHAYTCMYTYVLHPQKRRPTICHRMNKPQGFCVCKISQTPKRNLSHDLDHTWNCERKEKDEQRLESKTAGGSKWGDGGERWCQQMCRIDHRRGHALREHRHHYYRIHGGFATAIGSRLFWQGKSG